ncbi:hypothetical protein ABZ907_33260 [Nonomuraea wenchangensis]
MELDQGGHRRFTDSGPRPGLPLTRPRPAGGRSDDDRRRCAVIATKFGLVSHAGDQMIER